MIGSLRRDIQDVVQVQLAGEAEQVFSRSTASVHEDHGQPRVARVRAVAENRLIAVGVGAVMHQQPVYAERAVGKPVRAAAHPRV